MAAMAAARALTLNDYLTRRNRYDGLCANMEVAPEYDRATAASRYTEVPLFPSGRPAIAEEAALPEYPNPPPFSPPTPHRALSRSRAVRADSPKRRSTSAATSTDQK